jgi:hypothetical protein
MATCIIRIHKFDMFIVFTSDFKLFCDHNSNEFCLVCSIGGLLRAVGRVIRACHEERMICTSVAEPKINIL